MSASTAPSPPTPNRASGFSVTGFVPSPPGPERPGYESEKPGALPSRGPASSTRKMFSGTEHLLQPVATSCQFGGKGSKLEVSMAKAPFAFEELEVL